MPKSVEANENVQRGHLIICDTLEPTPPQYKPSHYLRMITYTAKASTGNCLNCLIQKTKCSIDAHPGDSYDEKYLTSLDEGIDHIETLNFGMLAEMKDKLAFRWMLKIAWAYGWDIQEEDMLGWYDRHRVKPVKAS